MRTFGPRLLISAVFAVAAAGLLAEPAQADKRMFRFGFQFFGPMGTTPGGVSPSSTAPPCGQGGTMGTLDTCGGANVAGTANATGDAFTIPPGILSTSYTYKYTGYYGYTSLSTINSYNGRGRFKANNAPNENYILVKGAARPSPAAKKGTTLWYAGTTVTHTAGSTSNTKALPNFCGGFTPPGAMGTETAGSGQCVYRPGRLKINPGPNKFGGTIAFLPGPNAHFEQIITFFFPDTYATATGGFTCLRTRGSQWWTADTAMTAKGARQGNNACTPPISTTDSMFPNSTCTNRKVAGFLPCGLSGTTKLGQLASSGSLIRQKFDAMTLGPLYTAGGENQLVTRAYYQSTVVPWTTGKVSGKNRLNYKNQQFSATGYDATKWTYMAGGMQYTKYETTRTLTYKKYYFTMTPTTTQTKMFTIPGITRIVSLIRPRIRHTFLKNNDPGGSTGFPYESIRMVGLRVFFLPEPGAMLLVGSGLLGLASLALLRRR